MGLVKQIACPACRREGGDTNGNNLSVYSDGLAWCEAGHGKAHGHPDYQKGNNTVMSTEKQKIQNKPNLEWLDNKGKWEEKGISNATLTEWGVGIVSESPGTLAFPFYEHGELVGYQYRDVAAERKNQKRSIWTEGRINLFGTHMLRGSDTLYLTEGLTDALTLYDVTKDDKARPDILAIPGASAVKFVQSNYSIIRKYRKIYLVPDNDDAGSRLVESVMSLPGISPYRTHVVHLTDHKDITDYRTSGDMFYFFEAVRNSQPYADSPFLYKPEQLESELEFKSNYKPFITGIPKIDEGLGGGLHREEFLGVVGFTGFGKSTLALYMATQIVKLNPEARVLIIGTEMNHRQNLKALAQMMTGKSWRGETVVTETMRQGAFSKVLGSEQVFLYKKSAYDWENTLLDIELAIVEHEVNLVLIDVVTDMWRVGKLDESAAVAKDLHNLTLGDEEKALPPVAVIGVFHTSGANDGLAMDKIRGGRAVGNRITAAIGVTGRTNDPKVPKDAIRKIEWLKKSRENAPDVLEDFYLEWKRDSMTYAMWTEQQKEETTDAKGKTNRTRRETLPQSSGSESAETQSDVDVRTRDVTVPTEDSTAEAIHVNQELRYESTGGGREDSATVVENIPEIHTRLSDTGDEDVSGIQGVADTSEQSDVPHRIPDVRGVAEGRVRAHEESIGTGSAGRLPIGSSWVNVDTQPISSQSGNLATSRRVPPANPQAYVELGMLPQYPSPNDRRLHGEVARGEESTVPRRTRPIRSKKGQN
ncbi:DNA primase/helicase [Arthronema virus TR020]|uniref:DNA primase/helicase n=1 Tax=Arthronema virus TR020 TaxID=2736280 RepID=A0A7G3WH29_9CAUD|nr:DNA primase/helicase [Arthronema virus TR020]